jgi:hypothetical protein
MGKSFFSSSSITPVEATAQTQTDPPPSYPLGLTPPADQDIVPSPLYGPIALSDAEVSGMAWYDDYLILLPQYTSRFTGPGREGSIFALPKADIIAFLDGRRTDPLDPILIPQFIRLTSIFA